MTLFKQLRTSIDCFKFNPQLNFKDKECISTKISQIVSVIFYFYIVLIVIFEFVQFFQDRDYNQTDTYDYPIGNRTIGINGNNVQIAINFTTDPTMITEYKKFLTIQLIQLDNDVEVKSFNMEKCNKSNLPDDFQSQYDDFIWDNVICLPKNFEAQIQYDDYKEYKNFKLQINFCQISQQNPDCQYDLIQDYTPFLTQQRNYKFYHILTIGKVLRQIDNENQLVFLVEQTLGYFDVLSQYGLFIQFEVTQFELDIQKTYFIQKREIHQTGINLKFILVTSAQKINYGNLIYENQRIMFVANREGTRNINIVYDDFFEVVLRIDGYICIFFLIFYYLCQFHNEKIYILELIKEILGKNIKLKPSHFYDELTLYNTLSDQEKRKFVQNLSYVNIIKTNQIQQQFIQAITSHEQKELLDIMSLNTSQKLIQYIQKKQQNPQLNSFNLPKTQFLYNYLNNQGLNKKNQNKKFKSSNKVQQDFQPMDVAQAFKDDILKNENNQTLQKDQKQANKQKNNFSLRRQNSAMASNQIDYFLSNLNQPNFDNINKNFIDILIEEEFMNYMREKYEIDFKIDQNQKYEIFSNQFIDNIPTIKNRQKRSD